MKKRSLLALLVLAALCATVLNQPAYAENKKKSDKPAIYNESLDGAAQISEALAIAKKENKHVLLQFGANWCGWCHRLHELFKKNATIAAKLRTSYVVVLIDVNKGNNQATNSKYGNPTRNGLPVIVILDAAGNRLTTQDTGELEEGAGHSPQKVLKFLNEWAPKK